MVTRIQKWGNSQELRLSKQLLRDADIDVGDEVEVGDSEAGSLVRTAWATRRSAFDKPPKARLNLMMKARDDLVQAVALCRDGATPVELAQSLHLLANLEQDLRRDDAALTLWLEAVGILREADDPLQLAHKVRHVGDLHRHCRRFDAADVCYEEAAALYRNHDTPWCLDYANAIRPMAILKERLGDREQSLALWREDYTRRSGPTSLRSLWIRRRTQRRQSSSRPLTGPYLESRSSPQSREPRWSGFR